MIAAIATSCAAALTGWTVSAFSSSAGNPGNTFATRASFSSCPGTTVTNGFTTGFEDGRRGYSASTVTASSTAMSIDGTAGAARTGTYSLKVATAGTSGYGQLWWPTIPYPSTEVARFALRLDAQPATDVTQLFAINTSGGAAVQLRYLTATNRFAVAIKRDATTAPTVVSGTTAVQVGTWHVVELRYDVSGATHTADWRVDGSAQTSASTAGSTASISTTQFGTTAAETLQAHYDDVLLSSTASHYPLGDGRVRPLRPSGMGTSVNPTHFQDDDGTAIDATSWQRLDEAPMADLTDYVQQVTVGASSYAELTLEDTTETCIRAAHAFYATHSPGTNQANNLKISVFDGAAESILGQGDMAANTTQSRNYAATVTPASTWTQAAVNGLVVRLGYGADVTPAQSFDSVLVEIEVPQ